MWSSSYWSSAYWAPGYWATGGEEAPTPGPAYSLDFWQRRCFKHRVDLWEPVRTAAGDGDVSARVYQPRYSSVPCYLERMPSADQMEMFGRTEQDDLFTRDEWWFHEHQEIGSTWAIVLRIIDANGDEHPDYGRVWLCAGDSRKWVDTIGREGHLEIVAIAQPVTPEGLG